MAGKGQRVAKCTAGPQGTASLSGRLQKRLNRLTIKKVEMDTIKVGIVGYGVIGRRVADAVRLQGDMKLLGVVKRTADYRARSIVEKGIPLYSLKEGAFAEGVSSGGINDLLREVDVVVDASPDGVGAANRAGHYEAAGVHGIFEGGEESSVADASFVAQANYEEAMRKRWIRVVSCNTTGLSRIISSIGRGVRIERVIATLIRRSTDPDESSKGPIDSIVPDPLSLPSHHADDVRTVLHGLDIVTAAVKVPVTRMHVHSLAIKLGQAASTSDIMDSIGSSRRILLFRGSDGFRSTSQIMDYARELNRPAGRGDLYELAVWQDSVSVRDGWAYMMTAVHQESIVVPENVDAIRASFGVEAAASMDATDSSLGIVRSPSA